MTSTAVFRFLIRSLMNAQFRLAIVSCFVQQSLLLSNYLFLTNCGCCCSALFFTLTAALAANPAMQIKTFARAQRYTIVIRKCLVYIGFWLLFRENSASFATGGTANTSTARPYGETIRISKKNFLVVSLKRWLCNGTR